MGIKRFSVSVMFLLSGLTGTAAVHEGAVLAKEPAAADALVAKVNQLVKAWEPRPEERRFDDIGWARDIRDALRLAKEHNRPVFLFTYSGSALREHAMALQRC
jgi:hypothetical protein